MIDTFATQIPDDLLDLPGHAFYTGETGFSGQQPLYLLGLNPGGTGTETIRQQLHNVKTGPADYSAYVTHTWKPAARIDHNVRHLLNRLSLEPTAVPASCVVLTRTSSEADLADEFDRLAAACWPFHQQVIDTLDVRVVVCFGKRAGDYVRRQLGAHREVDHFVETNNRGWKSTTHQCGDGRKVVTVTHPSRADWRNPAADVTPLVERALNSR